MTYTVSGGALNSTQSNLLSASKATALVAGTAKADGSRADDDIHRSRSWSIDAFVECKHFWPYLRTYRKILKNGEAETGIFSSEMRWVNEILTDCTRCAFNIQLGNMMMIRVAGWSLWNPPASVTNAFTAARRLWDYPCTFFDGCIRTIRAPGGEYKLSCVVIRLVAQQRNSPPL